MSFGRIYHIAQDPSFLFLDVISQKSHLLQHHKGSVAEQIHKFHALKTGNAQNR